MKIYILCIGNGADAGDWPELGDWYTFSGLDSLLNFAKMEKGLSGQWVNIDGCVPIEGQPTGPGTTANCLPYADDASRDPVARVHAQEILD